MHILVFSSELLQGWSSTIVYRRCTVCLAQKTNECRQNQRDVNKIGIKIRITRTAAKRGETNNLMRPRPINKPSDAALRTSR